MVGRYRISIDVCEDYEHRGNAPAVTSTFLEELAKDIVRAASIQIPAEMKKHVKIEMVKQPRGGWHGHDGNNDCSYCVAMSEDGLDADVEHLFPTKPDMTIPT